MSTQKKRTYSSEHRTAQAAETRKRILKEAEQLFVETGFEGVTIQQIAKAAKVSAPTVYSLFKSKRGVLFAIMDDALPTAKVNDIVEQSKDEKDPQKKMRYTAMIARQIYDSERKQMDLFRGALVLAPEFKELENEREKGRYYRQAEAIETLYNENALLPELTLSQAKDIFWAFTGRDFYRMLVIERGWSSDDYETWLTNILVKTLLPH